MKKYISIYLVFPVLMYMSCNKDSSDPGGGGSNGPNSGGNGIPNNEWSIPRDKVVDGGPGKDGIPALTDPSFTSVNAVNFLSDNDLVIGYRRGNDTRAYGHNVLNWHEIVNDNVNNDKIAIIYCPLTGTATGWSRVLPLGETTFGVSGLLYNTNIIPYDRLTNSNWSQMLLKSVNGTLIGSNIVNYQVIETSWKTWKEMFPGSKVLSTSTGFNRIYTSYPYGDYRTNNNSLLFGINPDDNRIPRKERVLAIIIEGEAKVYRFSSLTPQKGVIRDIFKGKEIVIAGNEQRNIIVAFENSLPDGTVPVFTADSTAAGILKDQRGNVWDAFGVAVSGPLAGQRLRSPQFIVGYWMAFGSFYPNTIIY